jgi:hypothetical protein
MSVKLGSAASCVPLCALQWCDGKDFGEIFDESFWHAWIFWDTWKFWDFFSFFIKINLKIIFKYKFQIFYFSSIFLNFLKCYSSFSDHHTNPNFSPSHTPTIFFTISTHPSSHPSLISRLVLIKSFSSLHPCII